MPSIADLRKNWLKGLLIVIGIANVGIFVFAGFRPDQLEHIYFFNVGQGDSALIKTSHNHYILIDGGPDNSVIAQLDSVMPIWHRQLDLVILTHPHADHATGLLSVLDQYQVSQFWYTGTTYDSETYKTLIAEVATKKIPIQLANQGDSYTVDGTNLKVIFPI
jgi:beta-lactamase superfamily II metal-dependent hydrolase